MTRRTATAALALAAITAAIAVAVAERNDAAGAQAARSLDLVMRLPEAQVTQVDAPPAHSDANPEDSPGDAIVLHAPVHEPAGPKAGQIDAVFTATAGSDREQIVATFTLGRDQIALQGIDGAAPLDRVAIVGGTGRYAGARGTLTARETGAARRFHLTYKQ
jgi:hypothetical protein